MARLAVKNANDSIDDAVVIAMDNDKSAFHKKQNIFDTFPPGHDPKIIKATPCGLENRSNEASKIYATPNDVTGRIPNWHNKPIVTPFGFLIFFLN